MCEAAEKRYNLGVAQGREEARKKGREKGVAQRNRELILKWTRAGRKTPEIANLLDFSEDEIRRVQAEE